MENTKHRNVSRRLTRKRATRILRSIVTLSAACACAQSLDTDLRGSEGELAELVTKAAQALPVIEGLLAKLANEATT